ncbi:MAG: hypothetical protein LC104_10890 [Bacteroidales bacterium]|nr:hypothetical protein [Bacteroidales bacterium]
MEDRIVPASVIYDRDFNPSTSATLAPGVTASWSYTNKVQSPSGEWFLGKLGNQTATLTLHNLPAHDSLNVEFDLYLIDTWDGNDPNWSGPNGDRWKFAIDGATQVDSTFRNVRPLGPNDVNAGQSQDYGGSSATGTGPYASGTGAVAINTLGYTWTNENGTQDLDSIYHFSVPIEHNATSVTITFTGSGLQGIGDESWGLDNVQVTAEQSASIAGIVYHDDNLSLNMDYGELGVQGQLVQLLSSGLVIEETSTDSEGQYQFTGLATGTYAVRIITTEDQFVAANTTVGNLYAEYLNVSSTGEQIEANFAIQLGSTPSQDETNPFYLENDASATQSMPLEAEQSLKQATAHGIDWSTLNKVRDGVKPWPNLPHTGSVWEVKTFSGKTILVWSGDPGQTVTAFCHGNSFGGLGIMVTENGQQVQRDFSPYSGPPVGLLLEEEYDNLTGDVPYVGQAGDIAIWRDADGMVIHSCIITEPDNRAPGMTLNGTKVRTKNGANPTTNTTLLEVNKKYSTSVVVINGVPALAKTTLEFWRIKP